VWAARDPDLEREVAIKLLHNADAGPEQRARLLREARAMARLKHPNVLTVYEVDSEADRDFIAMELVEGTSLDAWLEAKPPAEEVWAAVIAAGRGLAAAHAAGLVHRDFKPHNVLRSRDGRVLVTDFGLARGLGDERHAPSAAPVAVPPATTTPATPGGLDETIEVAPPAHEHSQPSGRRNDSLLDGTLTRTGAMMGTPAIRAPISSRSASPRGKRSPARGRSRATPSTSCVSPPQVASHTCTRSCHARFAPCSHAGSPRIRTRGGRISTRCSTHSSAPASCRSAGARSRSRCSASWRRACWS